MGPGCRDVNTKVRHLAFEDSWRADLRRNPYGRFGKERLETAPVGVSEGIKRANLLLSQKGLNLSVFDFSPR
jgi:hypothetical protein